MLWHAAVACCGMLWLLWHDVACCRQHLWLQSMMWLIAAGRHAGLEWMLWLKAAAGRHKWQLALLLKQCTRGLHLLREGLRQKLLQC